MALILSMEEVKVKIISREDIKPSSTTPSHLRTYKYSILDHLTPASHTPVIFFYTASSNPFEFFERLELLKQSLSETLTQLYPLCGKIKDDSSIDCNDEGANFVVAKVNCPIRKFLSNPDLNSLDKFIPVSFFHEISVGDHVTNIQVNVFECGGIAIGVCISHRIVDGGTFEVFFKMWIERIGRNRNLKPLTEPNFATKSLFPASTLHLRDLHKETWLSCFKEGNWVTKRFLFTSSAIATLKAQVLANSSSSDPLKNHPTRVQIVSAFLWKCLMAVSKVQFGIQSPFMIFHIMNLRRILKGSLHPENSIGNFLWITPVEHMSGHELNLDELVSKLKNSIQHVDENFVASLQSEEGNSIVEGALRNLGDKSRNMGDALESVSFTSWSKFGVYNADLGWGKPMWVSFIGIKGNAMFINTVILVETRFNDSIEAWVILDEKKMNLLMSSTELLTYATLDPSPLAVATNSRL
ncbi:hypothetical protein PIB30_002595 [Stylosanthes scabra]|uniref:Uncharacterized protein n=1 Tax=Stylosanthes scabra TaxID=79078 RepID=A0ABU6YZW5_9FABA|nr:hypothetical protein [Stylosanthes scabra]